MAQVTVSDLIDKATFTSSFSGLAATRQFAVEGLDEQPMNKLFQAASCPGIPRVGDGHPGNGQLFVSQVDVMPIVDSPTKAWVLVTYGSKSTTLTPPSANAKPTLEIGSVSSSTKTSQDKNGNQMVLHYDQKIPITNSVSGLNVVTGYTANPIDQPFEADVNESHPYILFGRLEPAPFDLNKLFIYQNKVNSIPWFGCPARTWYCNAIRATLAGANYQVSYEFQFRAGKVVVNGSPQLKTWAVEGTVYDTSNGVPFKDPVEGLGHKYFDVYQEVDFNALQLL